MKKVKNIDHAAAILCHQDQTEGKKNKYYWVPPRGVTQLKTIGLEDRLTDGSIHLMSIAEDTYNERIRQRL